MTNLVSNTFQRSGEVMVKSFHGGYIQVGYFAPAHNVYLAVALIIPQITLSFVSLMITLQTKGETDAIRGWVEQLLKWLAVGCIGVILGVLLLGKDLVPFVLGVDYRPIAVDLLPLSLSLLFLVRVAQRPSSPWSTTSPRRD
jgi:O-antigen/teichoic acid export membrane protein